jgi:hypothetical protein
MTICIRWKTSMVQAARVAAVINDVIHTVKQSLWLGQVFEAQVN